MVIWVICWSRWGHKTPFKISYSHYVCAFVIFIYYTFVTGYLLCSFPIITIYCILFVKYMRLACMVYIISRNATSITFFFIYIYAHILIYRNLSVFLKHFPKPYRKLSSSSLICQPSIKHFYFFWGGRNQFKILCYGKTFYHN